MEGREHGPCDTLHIAPFNLRVPHISHSNSDEEKHAVKGVYNIISGTPEGDENIGFGTPRGDENVSSDILEDMSTLRSVRYQRI
jgi:hypothetical protein